MPYLRNSHYVFVKQLQMYGSDDDEGEEEGEGITGADSYTTTTRAVINIPVWKTIQEPATTTTMTMTTTLKGGDDRRR